MGARENGNRNSVVDRAIDGDQEAFEELYRESYDAVYKTVKSMVSDEHTALELVQEAYVKGFRNLDRLQQKENFAAWMRRIAMNCVRDWYKKRKEVPFAGLEDENGDLPEFRDEREENLPEIVLDRQETARLVEKILSSLPDEQRIVVGMYYYEEIPVAQIARQLDVSVNTVKSRLYYARKRIRDKVGELEKQGIQLYSLSPVPYLLLLFKNLKSGTVSDAAPTAMFQGIMSQSAAPVDFTIHGETNPASFGAVRTTAAKAAAAAAAKASGGAISSFTAKIVAGVLAMAVLTGGVAAGVKLGMSLAGKKGENFGVEQPSGETTDPSRPNETEPNDSEPMTTEPLPTEPQPTESTPTEPPMTIPPTSEYFERVYQYVLDAQENEEALVMLPETEPTVIYAFYAGLEDVPLVHLNAYMAPVTGFACEVFLVEVENPEDVDRVKEIFQNRIEYCADDPEAFDGTGYLWTQNAQIQSSGSYIAMVVLPDGYTIPKNVFAAK